MGGKIIAIIPITNGNGGKYITTNLAHYYKEANSDKKISLVDFDVKNPFLGHALMNDEVHGVDNLIDKIDGNLLNESLFLENMVKLKNKVDLLKGTKLIDNHKLLTKKHAEKIIELLRNLYDVSYVSITADTNNAFSIYTLFEADEIILVSRNNQSTLKCFDRVMEVIKNYRGKESRVKLIHNMYSNISKVDVTPFIKSYNLDALGLVEYDEATIDNVNLISSAFKVFKNKSKTEESLKEIIKFI